MNRRLLKTKASLVKNFLLHIFAGRFFFLSRRFGLKSSEKTSCKALCIIIMKVFKQNRIKKSEIQIMFGTESEVREENNHA